MIDLCFSFFLMGINYFKGMFQWEGLMKGLKNKKILPFFVGFLTIVFFLMMTIVEGVRYSSLKDYCPDFTEANIYFFFMIGIGLLISGIFTYVTHFVLNANENLRKTELNLRKKNEVLKSQESYIQFLADHDPLTGLYNRRFFTEKLQKNLYKDQEGTLILIDLDNFKMINDLMGHVFGDKILVKIAEMIESIAGKNMSSYRMGGDEFLVIVEGENSSEISKNFLKKLMDKLMSINEKGTFNTHVSISGGVVNFPEDGLTVEDLMIKADLAMYTAKSLGKNQIKFFDNDMKNKFNDRMNMENWVRKALKENGFHMLYQPVVNSKEGNIGYLEALIRLKRNEISPHFFIPIAEETGMIIPLGRWVIEETVKQISFWQSKTDAIVPVAINLSPKQLFDRELMVFVSNVLETYQVDSRWIEFELTESILMEDSDEVIAILHKIKETGIKLALDDFGTGYSSLNYLTYMPVNKLKIDKSLKDRFIYHRNHKVMQGIIELAHGLDFEVVSEGVETDDEARKLKKYGSDFLQGYLFSKPISSDEVEKLMIVNHQYQWHEA